MRDALTDRQNQILKHVQDTGYATIEAMSEVFGVSTQTIRRDLIELEKQSFLIRFHGGAGLASNMFRIGYAEKLATSQDGKLRIARAIAAMLPQGATVYLDVGSTVEYIARELCAHRHLRIVTPSAAVAMIFAGSSHLDVFLTGGNLCGANGALIGEHAKHTLAAFRFDYGVTSFGGFDPEGAPMDFDPEKIALRRIAMENSLHRIGAVDSSKFTKHAMTRMAFEMPFTELVSDERPPAHIVDALAAAGTRLVIASERDGQVPHAAE